MIKKLGGDFWGYYLPQSFPQNAPGYISPLTTSQLDIRQYDWFTLFCIVISDDNYKELDAFVARLNQHQA